MSTEWTVVTGNGNKRSNVNGTKPQVIPEVKTNKIDKKQHWEATRQRKIDQFNAEFPILPGGKDLMTDSQKIVQINARIAAEKEANRKAYLVREARRQAKKEQAKKLSKIKEASHIQNMIDKWGAHRWYSMVECTADDCDAAYKLRCEKDECELRIEEFERHVDLELERKEKSLREEKERHIAEQTANMSESQKECWIERFLEEEVERLDCLAQAESETMYRNILIWENREIQDNNRLKMWTH
jgi:hypothetical protein